jgi:VCBS repeat-containing protein
VSAYFCLKPDAPGSNDKLLQPSIGKVETARGICTLVRPAQPAIQIKPGEGLYEGDVIETADGGQICIRLIDGTVFSLGSNARMALTKLIHHTTTPSALLHVARGCFSFIGGAIAKAGRFEIETPVAGIRSRLLPGGFGFLSFAGFFFATMEEIQAASSGVEFLDDGVITFKDLQHGIFELVTKEAVPRHILVDDPGETIVLRRFGSSISESHINNSLAQMLQFETAQQEALRIFSLGLQGPTATGASGSSTPPPFQFPSLIQPINFTQPNNSPPLTILDNVGASGHTPTPSDVIFIPPSLPSLAPSSLVERVNQTDDPSLDTASSTIALGGQSFSQSTPSFVWSAGSLTSDQIDGLTNASTLTVLPSGSGTANVSFSAPDNAFDFLAEGETLTITYEVTGKGANGATSTQPVVIKVVGTNDAPVLAADTSGPASGSHQVAELADHTGDTSDNDIATGTLTFSDVDLNDTHTASASLASIKWSGSSTLPQGLEDELSHALSTQVTDTGSGGGSVDFKFSASDKDFDFLAAGETLTVTYNVTVTDNHGVSSVQPVTITVTGSNDAPEFGAISSGLHVDERAGTTCDPTDDTASATLQFTDVDLDDTHSVATCLVSATASGHDALPEDLWKALTKALSVTGIDDSTGSGSGSVSLNFAVADKNFDFLAAGETLTVTYEVTVTDNNNASSKQPVTVTITGTNDAPELHLTSAYILDQFNAQDYGAWIEQNDDFGNARNGSPTEGEFQIAHDRTITDQTDFQIRLTDNDDEVGPPDLLSRTFDLSGAASATLTFDYRRDIPRGDANDKFIVQVSKDGINFTDLPQQIGATGNGSFVDANYQSFSYDLTPYISDQTTIRFSVGDDVDNGDVVYVDNVKIAYVAAATDPLVLNYTENSAVGVSAQITDVDSTTIHSATFTLLDPKENDVLTVVGDLPNGIHASDYSSGVLTLTGDASLDAYNVALQHVVFSNTSDNPDTSDRTLTITVNDGHDGSSPVTATIHVTAIDDAPVAANDHVITDDASAFQIPEFALLANDSDPDNALNQLSITSVDADQDDGASLGSGLISFTSFDDKSFNYTVSDGSLSDTARVSIESQHNSTNTLTGTDQSEIFIPVGSGSFTIDGKGGNDILIASSGGSTLNGGQGADTLIGGAGNDTFVFNFTTDSQPGAGHFDTIQDFTAGADHIDLAAINVSGTPTQIGLGAPVGAHSVAWAYDQAHDQTIVYVNASGNVETAGATDMEIHLDGTNIDLKNAFILHS